MGNISSNQEYQINGAYSYHSFSNEKDIMKFQPNIKLIEDKKYIDGILQIDEDQVEITKKKLGCGRTGLVEEGIFQKKIVAVKKFMDLNNMMLEEAKNEMRIMQILKNKNIISFYGGIITSGKIHIVMEKLDSTLFDLLTKNKFSLYERIAFTKQVCEAFKYLHQNRVLHGDYKTENVLYCCSTNTLKITDFGFSQIIPPDQDMVPHAKGSVFYLSPEVYKTKKAGFYSDVYSFGISLAVHINQKHPYDDQFMSEYDFLDLVCEPTNLRPYLPYRQQDCPPSLKSLCEMCWHADPKKRPSFVEIIESLNQILLDCSIGDEHLLHDIGERMTANPSRL